MGLAASLVFGTFGTGVTDGGGCRGRLVPTATFVGVELAETLPPRPARVGVSVPATNVRVEAAISDNATLALSRGNLRGVYRDVGVLVPLRGWSSRASAAMVVACEGIECRGVGFGAGMNRTLSGNACTKC